MALDRFLILAWLALAPFAVLAQTPHTHQHSFGNAQQWAHYFDDPARDAWQKPHEVIHALALASDGRIADIGAGTGYFTVRLAHMTPKGRVYAVDVEPDMVQYVAERARREKLSNVQAVQRSQVPPCTRHSAFSDSRLQNIGHQTAIAAMRIPALSVRSGCAAGAAAGDFFRLTCSRCIVRQAVARQGRDQCRRGAGAARARI